MKQNLLFLFLGLTISTLTFSQVANQPSPLEVCDNVGGNDGFATFDLTVNDAVILGSQSPNDYTVDYYMTEADALMGIDPVPTIYQNISNPQTIYAKVEEVSTGNFDTTTLHLRVLLLPTPLQPNDLVLCDGINSGDMTEDFDLTMNDQLIIDGQVGLSLSYYTSLSDSNSGINAISNPTNFGNSSSPQNIYVRVENDYTGCFVVVNFDLIVNALPQSVAVTDYVICDDNLDGVAAFDLSSKDSEVLNGQDPSGFSVTYHASQSNADNVQNALTSPYVNLSNPQMIFVSITDNNAGCSVSNMSFSIEVLLPPQSIQPTPLVVCDEDGDGFAEFDLESKVDEITGGNPNSVVTFHETLVNAETATNAIPSPYNNVNAFTQTLFVRVEDSTAGCYSTTLLVLNVNTLPSVDLNAEYAGCNDETLIIDTGLDTINYSFEWSFDGVLIPSETDSSLIVSQPGIYSVLVNDINGCGSFFNETIVTFVDCTDSDDDGVIDSDEDVNGNGNLDDDDTDGDTIPNYLDSDDDGDNVPTSIEINIVTGRSANALHPFVDTDGDLIENYLDDDDDGDGVLTVNEDYNNNDDPTDDDTDMSGVPDYLESNVALNIVELATEGFSMYPNPASNSILLTLKESHDGDIEVYDIQGKTILKQTFVNKNELWLNASAFESGLYFVKLNTGSKESIKKLIIN